jgi:glycosyltransferase involved in cell wall biosynthesis
MRTTARRARALFLWRSLLPGGVERTAITLMDHLRAPDWSFFLALLEPHGDFPTGARHPRRLFFPRGGPRTERQVEDLAFALKAVPRLGWYALRTQALLDRVRPDVLFTHSGVDVLVATALTRRRGAVWVASVGSDALSGISFRHPWGRPIFHRFLSAAYRRPDHVVAVSEGLRQRLTEDLGVPRARVSVIPNPVDLDRIQAEARRPLPESATGKFVLGVGRLSAYKGFDILIRVAARLFQQQQPIRLVILGDGEERESLTRLTRQLGIEHLVTMPGHEPCPWPWMSRALAVAAPSRQEGFSNVLVEAMACGAPVVATACHGPQEIVSSGVNGSLVPVGDELAFTRALVELLQDPGRRARYREAALRRVKEYSVTRVGEQYLSLFRRLAASAR